MKRLKKNSQNPSDQHNFYKTQFDQLRQLQKSEQIRQTFPCTTKALVIVERSERIITITNLLSISGEVERMYHSIHPDEGLGGIKLFLNPKFKTSLELQANFHTEEGITPQSVYSESTLIPLVFVYFLH